jgi:hypothetical protein
MSYRLAPVIPLSSLALAPTPAQTCFPPAWLDAADLRQGVFETHQIGPGPFYPSPDGRTLLVGGDPRQPLDTWQWRLEDLQSGKTTRLATDYELHYLVRCVWSLDESQVACLAYETLKAITGQDFGDDVSSLASVVGAKGIAREAGAHLMGTGDFAQGIAQSGW